MKARATTTITILTTSTTENGLGDEVENTIVAASGVPASIIEQDRSIYDNNSETPRRIRQITGRVASNVTITESNRVKDERTGTVYLVRAVSDLGNPVRNVDRRLDLTRTT